MRQLLSILKFPKLFTLCLFLFIVQGCGDSDDFVFTTNPQAAPVTSATFLFERASARLIVPQTTTDIRFRFYDSPDKTGQVVQEEVRDFAQSITISPLDQRTESVAVTALDQSGFPVLEVVLDPFDPRFAAQAAPGQVVIDFDGLPGQQVTLDSVAITPATATVQVGGTQQYTAQLSFSNDDTLSGPVAWSATGDATIDASTGLATGLAVGTATVTATANNLTSNTATLTITAVPPTGPNFTVSTDGTFDTDSGEFTPTGGTAAVVDGWSTTTNQLDLVNFTVNSGVTLQVVGSNPFTVQASNDVTVDGTIERDGADGADTNVNGVDGGPGEAGGVIALTAGNDLVVSSNGVISTQGGDGGDNSGNPTLPTSGGPGGDGGDIALSAGNNLTLDGQISGLGGVGGFSLSEGGAGGSGGDLIVSATNSLSVGGTLSSEGGSGGEGRGSGVGSPAGRGGNGGEAVLSGSGVAVVGTVSTQGGTGGPGSLESGAGGNGGEVTLSGTNTTFTVSGSLFTEGADGGGGGGRLPADGGNGGNGGDITLSGTSLTLTVTGTASTNGGDGTNANFDGGNGGDGGDVNLNGNTLNGNVSVSGGAGGTSDTVGIGGTPGADGADGTNNP